MADRDTLKGNPPVEVVVPKTGVVAGVYVQAISAYAPHPNAAKLWMEYLYSDEGQLGWLKGYCHPIRFNDLVKNGKVPQELLDKLPPAAAYEARCSRRWTSRGPPRRSSPSSGTRWSAPTSSRPAEASDRLPPERRASTPLHAAAGACEPAPTSSSGTSPPAWLGVTPFFVFALMFLILPTLFLVVGGFQDADGNFTLAEHRQPVPAHDPQRLLDQHQGQRRLGHRRRR